MENYIGSSYYLTRNYELTLSIFLTKNIFVLFVPGWKGQVLHKSGGGAALRLRVQGSPTARGSTGENIKLMSSKSGNSPL